MNRPVESFIPNCEKCGGSCCNYVAIEIDKPTTKQNCDHIRWYLLHKDVNVFIDHDKNWFVEFRTPCEKQNPSDYKCTIYSKRPKICRDHGNDDESCEYYDSPYFKYFSNAPQFEKYLNSRGIDWRYKNLK